MSPEEFIKKEIDAIEVHFAGNNQPANIPLAHAADLAFQAMGMVKMAFLPEIKHLLELSKGNRIIIQEIERLIEKYTPPTIHEAARVPEK